MSTEVITEVEEQTLDCWPPVIHIVDKPKNEPVVAGDIAICGAKLMGIEFEPGTVTITCEKCKEIMIAILSK